MDRQKIILIFAGAWVSAALLTWFVFSRAASGKTEKMISVVAARQDLPAGTRIRQGDLKRMNIPEKDAPKTVIVDEAAVVNRVLMHPLSAGEPIVSVKTTSVTGADGISASIQHGMRAISISINDSSSAGGLIQPRSHVDVLFTRTGTMREAITATIVQDVQVISIGRLTEIAQASDPKTAPQQTGSQLRAATLLVTPDQASKVELARNQGKVSLVLRNPLDRT
ncbi:MAG: Flp pilus assembly protein CpaB, partial [Bryobacteraceae bacterium]|nr:Flp pilus assembly protein CpaB [Bryobacteraceae bacterium]